MEENLALQSDDKAGWVAGYHSRDDWNKFANANLAFCYPSYWNKDDSGIFGSERVLMSSFREMMPIGSGLNQNINNMRQEQSSPEGICISNLDEHADNNKFKLEFLRDDAEIFSFVKTTLAATAAYRNVMRAVQNGSDLY
jgi:hypothetical protein